MTPLKLVGTGAPEIDGRFEYDPEAGMFCAYGGDRAAFEKLGTLMAAVANDGAQLRKVVAGAKASGFAFDD